MTYLVKAVYEINFSVYSTNKQACFGNIHGHTRARIIKNEGAYQMARTNVEHLQIKIILKSSDVCA